MNRKIEITEYIAKEEGLDITDKSIRQLLAKWWQNPRPKEVGGLKLTDEGFAYLTKHFKHYQVKFENLLELNFTNTMILRLDKFITCPWYLTRKEMFVFDDKMAIQLVLFSGNIEKFTTAKSKSLESS